MKFMRVPLAARSARAESVASGLAPVPVTSASAIGANRGPAKRLLIRSAGWLVTGDRQFKATHVARTAAGAEPRPARSLASGRARVERELPDA
jgi:hypothetical protein